MNRRDFFKILGIGTLGAIAPEGITNMATTAQLLGKALRGERLLESEIMQIERDWNSFEKNQAYVNDRVLKNFNGVSAEDPLLFKTLGAKISRASLYAVANNTYTYLPYEVVDYNNFREGMVDLTIEPTKVFIQTDGRYTIGINIAFEGISSGYWRADIVVNKNISPVLASGFQSESSVGTLNYPEDVYLSAGDYVETRLYQNSGASKDAIGNMYVRWLGID